MGVLWELFQEYQLSRRSKRTGSLEERVAELESELEFIESLLEKTIPLIEQVSGQEVRADLE